MFGPYLHVFTLKFLALRKTGFSPIKNTSQLFFDFCLPLFYETFQCRLLQYFQKNLNWFFTHENFKKMASKVAHIGPNFFFTVQPTTHRPELIINMCQDTPICCFKSLWSIILSCFSFDVRFSYYCGSMKANLRRIMVAFHYLDIVYSVNNIEVKIDLSGQNKPLHSISRTSCAPEI